MGSTLEQISEYLQSENLQHRIDQDRGLITTGFDTEKYLDQDGEHQLQVVILLEEEGRFFRVFTPHCYSALDETNRLALMQTLLMISWRTQMVQFEYDDSDGEIRAMIEYPLEDADLTEKQFFRSINTLVQTVDRYHPVIHKALREGVIEFDDAEKSLEDLERAFVQFAELLTVMGIELAEIRKEMELKVLDDEENDDSDVAPNDKGSDSNDDDDDDEYI